MEIGVYQLKYPFRKMIKFLLPYFKNASPNAISLSLIPIGIVTAIVYCLATDIYWFYLLGILLIFLRMVIGTLDGLVAVTYNKSSDDGEMINRLSPEIADILLMIALVFSNPKYVGVGIVAMGICWATTFFGLLGLVAGKKIQSVGPVGQTDRVVALMFFSLLQYLSLAFSWQVDFIFIFWCWVVVGGLVTVLIRCYRNLSPDQK